MSIYTVYEPPLRAHESAPDPERFVFVRDGFSIWAFLLAPLWMLRHRLWLAFLGYVIVVVALSLGLRAIGASATLANIVTALVSLLVGFEAAHVAPLRARASGLEECGHRRRRRSRIGGAALLRRVGEQIAAGQLVGQCRAACIFAASPGVPMARRMSSDVIGLFPQPGAPR